MRILFLDQTGKIGGAELVLLDNAKFYRDTSLVALFEDGDFRHLLEKNGVSTVVLSQKKINFKKGSSIFRGILNIFTIFHLISKILFIEKEYDLIYANTLKSFVLAAIANLISRKPLVFHLHDILSVEHFGLVNCWIIVQLSNLCARKVITVSQAARAAFIAAGGNERLIEVVYNGFDHITYDLPSSVGLLVRNELRIEDKFIVGCFSRLGHWKGQHILIEALNSCSENVVAILVGGNFFGVEDYVDSLHKRVIELGLSERVYFLGFRSDVPQLLQACNIVVHTSVLPEPAGRVLVEALLAGKPLIATQGGGTDELVDRDVTGYLISPSDPQALARTIQHCIDNPQATQEIAQNARTVATERFSLETMYSQIDRILTEVLQS